MHNHPASKPLHEPNLDASRALGLRALGWAVSELNRAQRMLALTGLTPDSLRQRASDPVLLAAVIGFLEAHEPDLIACAEAIDATPRQLVDARADLER